MPRFIDGGPLPGVVLTGSNTLNGGGSIIDGTTDFTGYFLMGPGNLDISNVTLQNFTTVGGMGSGGGAGFGGAIFITNETLNLNNVNLIGNIAKGGAGGNGQIGGNLNNNILSPTSYGPKGINGDNANTSSGFTNFGNGVEATAAIREGQAQPVPAG